MMTLKLLVFIVSFILLITANLHAQSCTVYLYKTFQQGYGFYNTITWACGGENNKECYGVNPGQYGLTEYIQVEGRAISVQDLGNGVIAYGGGTGSIPYDTYHTMGPIEGWTKIPNTISWNDYQAMKAAGFLTCPSPCTAKKDQSNYKLDIRSEGVPANLAISCYEDCKTTAVELWEDCVSGQCVSSIKHTFTGEPCSGQPAITDLEPNQPNRCDDEINAKISACGGSLNVQSFDFHNCTGTCTPDSCSDAYALKVQSCGGVMAVASWDNATCKGTCVSDPIPQEPGPTDKPPVEIERKEVVNNDGSKEETRTTTQYNSETNTTYTTTTTTTYNSSGVQTGQTTSTTISPGKPNGESQGEEPGETETFAPIVLSGFGEAYTPSGEYDIPVRFNTFLNTVQSSGLFSFSSGFFNSIPGGGSPVFTINGGQTFGSHSIDLSENMTAGLAVLKSILMACFGFLSIRAIIMKR